MAEILNCDLPAIKLDGGGQSNAQMIILCNRSCCAIRPAVFVGFDYAAKAAADCR